MDTIEAVLIILPEFKDQPPSSSYLSIITSCISDAKFCAKNQNLFVSRNFLNVSLWDIRKEGQPVLQSEVHKHLRPHFAELFDREFLFDQFRCDISPTGRYEQAFALFC